GAGGFSAVADVAASGATSMAMGDFNGDGKQDLAITSDINRVYIRLGNGAGGFSAAPDIVGNDSVSDFLSVAVGDFNGDGKQDLAAPNASNGTVKIRLGDGV